MTNELTAAQLENLRAEYESDHNAAIVARAVKRVGVNQASYDSAVKAKLNRTFSVEVETGKVSNQKHSGRCWMFSLLNTLRHGFAKEHQVKNFELSQSYLYFWDKIERANIYYDNIIRTAAKPTDDREVSIYLSMPGDDGGQWNMAASLVQKYGVVPSDVMPETFNTDNTSGFADALDLKLRRDALQLRELVNAQATEAEITAKRQKMQSEVYRMTAMAVGEPPKTFDLEYRDDNKKYHLDRQLTPVEFFNQYFSINLNDYVILTNAPDHEMNQTFRLNAEENVVGGQQILFVNVPMSSLRRAAVAQLQAGETVWFGNDVGKQSSRDEGLLDTQLYQREELFGVDLSLSKAERFALGEAEVTHAMTLTGVDLVDDQPTKWKVENSWGGKVGDDGYFVMSDDWFEEFTYQVVVQRKYLTAAELKVADSEPVSVPAWDSMM